jgi:peptidoglycan/xylan/chitin deacetylase (PgdA/CDA1 family)
VSEKIGEKLNRILAVVISVLLATILIAHAFPSYATESAVAAPPATGSAVAVPSASGSAVAVPSASGSAVAVPSATGSAAAVSSPAGVATPAGVTTAVTPSGVATAATPSGVATTQPATTYAAFTSSFASTLYLPGTDLIRLQPIRTYLDRSKPMVALTFDDGPAQYTEHVVDLLEKYDCRATFCMLGERIKAQTDRVRRVAAQGSQIVGHSWDHKSFTAIPKKKVKRQLQKTDDAIKAITGEKPKMYRPPYGAIDKGVRKASKKQRLAMLMWSIDTLDWKYRNEKKILKKIQKDVADGKIILLHDIHETTANAMDSVIPWLQSAGYELVTVAELMYYRGDTVKPGQTYNGGY